MMASFKQKSAVFDYFKKPYHTSGEIRVKALIIVSGEIQSKM